MKNNDTDTQLTGDNTGNNITEKNQFYSELTGIYWAWKNQKSEIVGSCHYRRFFTAHNEPFLFRAKRALYYIAGLYKKRFGLIYTGNTSYWDNKTLNCNEATDILTRYDAIMPVKRKFKYTVETHFKRYHRKADLDLLKTIIKECYPDYENALTRVLGGKRLYANNMFVMKRPDFENLCNWLFTILFEFEKRTNLHEYKGYQVRIFGFLSERLITTWVFHNQLNVKELPLIYFKHLKKND